MMLWALFRALWAFWLRGRCVCGVCMCCHFLVFQWEPCSGHQAARLGKVRTNTSSLAPIDGRSLTVDALRFGATGSEPLCSEKGKNFVSRPVISSE